MATPASSLLFYQSGFGNQFSSEAVAGALPQGRNSPQQAPLGLVAELISGSAFTAPRHLNQRTWVYRRDRKSTRLNSSHLRLSRMPSSA